MKQDRITEYLDTLTSQMRYKKARASVRQEISQHLEDQVGEYLMEGMSQEDAEKEAVRQMGDPVEVGISMDRIHRPQMPWGMLLWIGVLSLVGFAVQAALQAGFPSLYIFPLGWERQLLFLAIGLALMILVCFLDYSRIGAYAREITVVLWVICYLGTSLFGREINGSYRWIAAAFVSIHTGMVSWLFVPLYAGILYRYRGGGYRALGKSLLWMLPTLWFLLTRPDISNLALVFVSFSILLSVAVWKGWFQVRKKAVLAIWWGGSLLLPMALILAFVGQENYQGARVRALLGMEGEPAYGVTLIRRLLSNVHLLGNGGTETLSQLSSMEERGTVLTYGIAYYGILAAMLLMAAIVFLIFRFLKISLRQKNQLGMLMGTGCSVVFFWELFTYICSSTGILRIDAGNMVNSFCPFLTYGGTGTVITYLLLGLLLSVCRYQKVSTEEGFRKQGSFWQIRRAGDAAR